MRAPFEKQAIVFDEVGVSAGETLILDAVSFAIPPGAPTVLLGPNGAGKSTVLRLIAGLLSPARGRISWSGAEVPDRERLAIVFQTPVMMMRSAAANLRFAAAAAGIAHARRAARVEELLTLVGLADKAHRPARRLSGGERQRLAIARALAREPATLLLDEPTANLDPAATRMVEHLIAATAARGVKIILSTQDLAQARRLAGDIIFLHRGRMFEATAAERFFSNPETDAARRFLAGELLA